MHTKTQKVRGVIENDTLLYPKVEDEPSELFAQLPEGWSLEGNFLNNKSCYLGAGAPPKSSVTSFSCNERPHLPPQPRLSKGQERI